jgi:SAM-dependent methyltransferase
MSVVISEHMKSMLENFSEDKIIPERVDHYKLWKDYSEKDPSAICGGGTNLSRSDSTALNARLYTQMGALNYLTPWGRVLDIGAGYGSLRYLLSQYHEYVPIDVYPHIPESTLVTGDGTLPFEDKSFDFVYCSNVMQHLHDSVKFKYIEEIYRVLSDNGRAFLSFSVHSRRDSDLNYAITDDYFIPLIKTETVDEVMQKSNLCIIMKTFRRDGYTSWWAMRND